MITAEELRFFVAVAGAGSLAAAARHLNVTPPAVTQRLRILEGRLGVRLANRLGRHMTLTDEGELLARRGAAILSELNSLSDEIAARQGLVVGRLSVIAPLGFGRRYVAPAVASFGRTHPGVTIDLTLTDRLGRHPGESWDVAVYVGELPDTSMIVQKLAPNRRLICAAPSYLAGHAPPEHPSQLRDHDCIALRENDEDVTLWRFQRDRQEITIRIDPRLASNDGDVVRAWALAGEGIIVRSEWDVADELRAGGLVALLEDYALPEADVVALLGSRHGRSARTRMFLEHLKSELSPAPWRA